MIRIICLGKIKEKYFIEAIEEYSKRISKYSKIEIVELKDLPIVDNPSDEEIKQILDKEADSILKNIGNGYNVILDRKGEMLDSIEFSNKLSKIFTNNASLINFIIGSSYGLSERVTSKANYSMSFSKLTFPHQLFRVILLEAIYRSFKILNNETYHK